MRVLLAEDEADLATVLQRTLREEGYVCDWAADGESALHQALHGPYEGFFRQTGPDAPYLVVRAADGAVLVETPAAPASGAAPAARREVEAAGPFGTHIRVGRGGGCGCVRVTTSTPGWK